jgi:hypothetical protein
MSGSIHETSSHFRVLDLSDVIYRGAAKSLARPTSRCILFDGENISFDASLVIYRLIKKSLRT